MSRRGAFGSCPGTPPTGSRTTSWRWPPRPGLASGGSTAAAATPGTRSPTTPSSTFSTSALATDRRGNRKIRSPGGGDNLFLCSIVALDPDTGEYLWHYQTTPGETWDYNSNMGHRPRRSHHRRTRGQGDPPRPQERLLLRDRPRDREADLGRTLRRGQLGDGDRSADRAAGGGRGREIRGSTGAGHAFVRRRAQLARHVVQPADRIGIHTCNPPRHDVQRRGYRPRSLGVARGTRRHGGINHDGRLFKVGRSPGFPAGVGPPTAGARMGDSAARSVERRNDDDSRQPGVPRPHRRNLRGPWRQDRRDAVDIRHGFGDLGASDHLRDRRTPVRGPARGLGRRVGGDRRH